MHSKRVGWADSDDSVAIDCLSAVLVLDKDRDQISVLYSKLNSILICHVDVSLGNDDTFLQLHLSLWSDEGARSAALCISRLSDWSVETD